MDPLKKFANLREKPLLLLSLPEVNRVASLTVKDALSGKKENELDVILQTPGGDIDAAFCIIKLLRNHAAKINIFVPWYAKSAGTLICLGADRICLSELSELGPLDSQIHERQDGDSGTYKSALNGFKALDQIQNHAFEVLDAATKIIASRSDLKMSEAIGLAIEFVAKTAGNLYAKLDPMVIGAYTRALEVGENYGVRVLTHYMKWNNQKASQVVKSLVRDYPSHEFVIDLDELTRLGLPVHEISADELPLVEEIGKMIASEQTPQICFVKNDVKTAPEPAQQLVEAKKKQAAHA